MDRISDEESTGSSASGSGSDTSSDDYSLATNPEIVKPKGHIADSSFNSAGASNELIRPATTATASVNGNEHRSAVPCSSNLMTTLAKFGGTHTIDNKPTDPNEVLKMNLGLTPSSKAYKKFEKDSKHGTIVEESSSSRSGGTSEEASRIGHESQNRSKLDSKVCEMNLSELDDAELQKLVDIYCGQTEQELEAHFNFLNVDKHVTSELKTENVLPPKPNITDSEIYCHFEEKQKKEWERQLNEKRDALLEKCPLGNKLYVLCGTTTLPQWPYKPSDYDNLVASADVKELFPYITQKLHKISKPDMAVQLKPFIPEYYPCIGEVDAFLKVVETEISGIEDGKTKIDEIIPEVQSDPAVMALQLRSVSKQIIPDPNMEENICTEIKKVSNVAKNKLVVENWIEDVCKLHEKKRSPTYRCKIATPNMDDFSEEWPKEIEDLLPSILSADLESLDCDLNTMVDLLCSILDIPMKDNRIEALHILTSIYAEQKQFLMNRNKFRAGCKAMKGMGSANSEFSNANEQIFLEKKDHLILRD